MKNPRRTTLAPRLCILLGLALLPCLLDAQEAQKLVPALGWDRDTQGGFVTSVAVDLQNNVWAGTEGKGLWRYDSRGKKWTQFTTNDGLGDDCVYALAVDKLGRVWAGHLNHGVSVWNGEKWKNYGLLDGPLGDRVFSIATCSTDGDVWIATDCGVARYSLAKDDWDYYTQAGGLPSNQIQSIAFHANGDVLLGTQCDGVATARAARNYKKWKIFTGPMEAPNSDSGSGLPTSLINNLTIVTTQQMPGIEIPIATTPVGAGVYMDTDGGFGGPGPGTPMGLPRDWMFSRGADWQANENGLYDAPKGGGGNAGLGQSQMSEDWIVCVRQDGKTGNLWTGYRTKGIEVRKADTDEITATAGTDSGLVHAICLPAKGPPLIAICDARTGGLMTLEKFKAELEPGDEAPKPAPPLPAGPKATDADTFTALTKQLDLFKTQMQPGEGVFLGDDWRTEGDWVGRYGGAYAMLCGQGTDGIFQLQPGFDVAVTIGPHNKAKPGALAAAQSYIANKAADDLRTLYNPAAGHRVEAELNDFSTGLVNNLGTDYPPAWEGPDLWVDVKVPAGIHRVSLYFTNNDSQKADGDPHNKLRDYDVQLLAWGENKDALQKSTPLARARVTDFYGGVYKQFAVAGPARYVVRVGRNHSFVTKLQGVFIDQLAPNAPDHGKKLPGFETVSYAQNWIQPEHAEAGSVLPAAEGLWARLDQSFDKPGAAGLQLPLRIIALRAAVASPAQEAILMTWRWKLGIWTKEDRDGFDKAMADAFKAWSAKNPQPAPKDDESAN